MGRWLWLSALAFVLATIGVFIPGPLWVLFSGAAAALVLVSTVGSNRCRRAMGAPSLVSLRTGEKVPFDQLRARGRKRPTGKPLAAQIRDLEAAVPSHEAAVNRGENRAIADWLARYGNTLGLDHAAFGQVIGMLGDDPDSDQRTAEQLFPMFEAMTDRHIAKQRVDAEVQLLRARIVANQVRADRMMVLPDAVEIIPLEPKSRGLRLGPVEIIVTSAGFDEFTSFTDITPAA